MSQDVIGQIAHKFIAELNERLAHQDLSLQVSDAALKKMTDEGYDVKYGARPLKRYIQKHVETPLARIILSEELNEGSILYLDVEDENFKITNITLN